MRLLASQMFLLVALTAVMLSGCGPAEKPVEATPTASTTSPEPDSTATIESTIPDATASLPGMPANLCAEPPNIISFEVWQDFMPGPSSSNPVHAALTLELQCPDGISAADIGGNMVITRSSGSEVISAPMQLDSMADTATAGVKQLALSIQPGPPSGTLTEGERVTGIARITMGKDLVEVQLPETELLFTR